MKQITVKSTDFSCVKYMKSEDKVNILKAPQDQLKEMQKFSFTYSTVPVDDVDIR